MIFNHLLIYSPISKLILLLTYWKLSDTDPRYIIKNLVDEPCFSGEKKIIVVREIGILIEDSSLLLSPQGEQLRPDSIDVNNPRFNITISPIGKDIVSILTEDSTLYVRINKKGTDEITLCICSDEQGAHKLAEIYGDPRLSYIINRIISFGKSR